MLWLFGGCVVRSDTVQLVPVSILMTKYQYTPQLGPDVTSVRLDRSVSGTLRNDDPTCGMQLTL